MGVISFRRPEDGVEQLQNALSMMQLIKEIASNKDIHATVDDLSQKLVTANQLTEEKKKEAMIAQETIAQAGEARDQLLKDKLSHQATINQDLKNIEAQYKELQVSISQHETDKTLQKKLNENVKVEAEKKHSEAKDLFDQANKRISVAQKMEKDHTDHERIHAQELAAFEKEKLVTKKMQDERDIQHEKKVQDLIEDRKTFELRKQRFEDALKG